MTRWLLAAAALGLAARLAFGLGYWTDKPLTRDEREYLSLARSLAAGRGFVYDDPAQSGVVDPFGRAPGYPLFLALAGGGRDVRTTVPASVKLVQSFAGAFGVVMAGLVAWRLAGASAARAASILAALYPPLVWTAGYALTEALAWPMGLAAVWCFDRAVNADRPWRPGLAAGVLIAALSLVRPSTLFFPALAAVWLVLRRRYALVLALSFGVAVVILPWTVRNYEHHGRLVLVATEGGITFWTGNHPLARGDGDIAANPDLKRAHAALRAQYPSLTEEQFEPVLLREAFAWIRAHPLEWLALELRKAFYLVVPIGSSYTLHSRLYYATSVVSYGAVLPLAVLGSWRLGSRRGRSPGLWLFLASAVLVCLVFFPQERFRIPVIDPTLIVCAGAWWAARRGEAG
jgi:4-amino-4-deoxy-L-arabinose transferase-like glycosyltransferase